jgi:hypothetical protein
MKKILLILLLLSMVLIPASHGATGGGLASSTASATYVKKAGDTMTGTLNGTALVLSGNASAVNLTLSGTGSMESLFVTGSATISGNATAGHFYGDGSTLTGIGGTAGNNSWTGLNTFEAGIWIGTSGTCSIDASGNMKTAGGITAATLNGYTFNQALLTTSSPTFTGLNTGTFRATGLSTFEVAAYFGTTGICSIDATNFKTSGNIVANDARFASIVNSALTSGRLTYAGATGVLQDSANFTIAGSNLNVATSIETANVGVNTKLYLGNLTATRIPYVDSDKGIIDSANMTFNGTRLTLLGNIQVGEIHSAWGINTAEASPNTIGTAAQTTFYGIGSNLTGIGGTAGNNTWTNLNTFSATAEVSRLRQTPSAVASITAAGGINPTKTYMRITGEAGSIDISANPQIAVGTDGDMLILEGRNDTATIKLDDGTGLVLQGGQSFVLGKNDIIKFIYNATDAAWIECQRSDN